MMPAATLQGFRRNAFRFAADARGMSAVEFAIVLPFMLALYLGSVELGNGLAVQFRTTLAARTVADLTSQYVSVDKPTINGIMGAASTVMAPYSAASMVVTLSEVTTDNKGQGSITWSDALHGTPRAVGQPVTLPANLQTPNISVIWGEVTYPYTPALGYVVTGTITLYRSVYFYPRLSTTVACNGC